MTAMVMVMMMVVVVTMLAVENGRFTMSLHITTSVRFIHLYSYRTMFLKFS